MKEPATDLDSHVLLSQLFVDSPLQQTLEVEQLGVRLHVTH